MNRFQGVVDGITLSVAQEIGNMALTENGHWKIEDGGLVVEVAGQDYEFMFEKNDPDSEAILLLLNNLPHILQTLLTKRPPT